MAEYLELGEKSDVKLEYDDGEIVAMSGGTESPSLITTNVISAISTRLQDKPCRVYDSNLRVSPATKKSITIPTSLLYAGKGDSMRIIRGI